MENKFETLKTKLQPSVQILCVLTILTADKAIEKAAEKYIDLYNESIDWDSIFYANFSSHSPEFRSSLRLTHPVERASLLQNSSKTCLKLKPLRR
jgi:hypothetical protein